MQRYRDVPVLITGGLGFIGSNLAIHIFRGRRSRYHRRSANRRVRRESSQHRASKHARDDSGSRHGRRRRFL